MSSPVVVQEFPVEVEYRKETGITPADVAKLRSWLHTQPHLPGAFISELELILIYHCCDRSAEVSKQVLDLHFTLRTLFNNFFKDRFVDERILETLSVVLALPLDGRSYHGHGILYARLIDYDVKKFVFADAIRVVIMALDLWQIEQGTWPGAMLIIDMEGVSLGHLPRLDLHSMQRLLYYMQEAILCKLVGIHFMNAPSFMDKILMLIRPFVRNSFLEMISMHQVGTRTLEKFIPMEILPKDAGGQFKTLDRARDDVIARFKANEKFFAAENKKRVVEALRPGKPKTISDIFGGVEGSFKKLDID